MTTSRRAWTATAIAVFSLAACSSTTTAEPTATTEMTSARACASKVVTGEVPEWARSGFSPGAVVPHVVGDRGRIVAVLFSHPLVANTDANNPQNKVLLVAKEAPQGLTPVTIDARLQNTETTVERIRENGPGPGSLDLPEPGCWSLTLRWGDQTDTMDLEYVAAASPSAPATG